MNGVRKTSAAPKISVLDAESSIYSSTGDFNFPSRELFTPGSSMDNEGAISVPNASDQAAVVEYAFEQFFTAVTCKSILSSFYQLLDVTGLRHANHLTVYSHLKEQLKTYWKAQALWAKLDKRALNRDYGRGKICSDTRVLIIGAGPCGLRTAIECAFLGARAVIVEMRDRFSRNNVLHLWPFLITDLKNLGAKMFFGKFCAGAIDHISIRQLQCILLKVALLVGVEVYVNVTFDDLIEPPEDQTTRIGWRCKCTPQNHPVSEYEFDVLIGADGKRNTLSGFNRKEFRGKLAIAITANFINRNTNAEARVEEISGVAFIFNQKFFLDLKEKTGIDLENIVYYKDDTHYFVMTAKKQSLLDKNVLKQDHADTITLLDRSNINQEALMDYAREAADFSTNHQLPVLEYAVNHYGQADVAMFDFTSMFAAENACRAVERNGHKLLMALVGDSLLEPFWPTGSGCGRGFLGAFDTAWMIRSWASGQMTPLQVIAERESIYSLLSQTTPQRLHKNYHKYSLDPNTRYPNLNMCCIKPKQVLQLYDGFVDPSELEDPPIEVPAKRPRNVNSNEYHIDSYSLLRWCQRVLNTGMYRGVHIVDFTSSWRSGLAFCTLIHAFRPNLINLNSLMESEVSKNNQLAFDVAQKELGVAPVMTGMEMASCDIPDKLTMVAYLSQFYQLFKHEPLPSSIPIRDTVSNHSKDELSKPLRSPSRRISLLNRITAKLSKSKKRKEDGEESPFGSKKHKDGLKSIELTKYNKLPVEEIASKLHLDGKPVAPFAALRKEKPGDTGSVSVTAMAEVLVAKFKSNEDQPAPPPVRRLKGQPMLPAAQAASEFCFFCNKRVYIMERLSAEGVFFHRHCLKCDFCGVGLRINNYSCEKLGSDGVKFYCYRHFAPELRVTMRRKRNFERADEEKTAMTIPAIVTRDLGALETPLRTHSDPQRRIIPAPLQVPSEPSEKAKKTPERIEFEISFDGQEEETEEEQFEYNLRASLSSDTILDNSDDDDSDTDDYGFVSDSEVARILDEWSGTEEDVWDPDVEGLKGAGAGAPWTWEEACELVNTWNRQHSTESLLQAVNGDRNRPRHPSRDAYSRFYDGKEDSEESEDDSSTEVEDSEYETVDSSGDESTEEEDEITRGECSTEDTLGCAATEDSATTTTASTNTASSPLSPAIKNAARASFFSAPPTVVRLDHWRMFNKDQKDDFNQDTSLDKNNDEEVLAEEICDNFLLDDIGQDEEYKDTDVSESLDLDSQGEESHSLSAEGSLENMTEDLQGQEQTSSTYILDEEFDQEEEEKNQNIMGRREDETLEEEQNEDTEEEDQNEEEMERSAFSLALEKLLDNMEAKSSSSESSPENGASPPRFLIKAFNDKFLMKEEDVRETVRGKDANRDLFEERDMNTNKDLSEEKDENSFKELSEEKEKINKELSEEKVPIGLPSTPKDAEQLNNFDDDFRRTCNTSEDTIELVLRSVREMDDGTTTASGEDTLWQVLQEVASMPDLLDSERELDKHHDKQFRHLDERFVTDRKKIKKPSPIKQVKSDSESSLTISTPSESCSSSSGSLDEVIKYNQRFLDSGGPEDMKPDQDMLEDYLTTMSMVLDESLSEEENDSRCKQLQPSESLHPVLDSSLALQEQNIKQNKHESEVADKTLVTNTSSLYLTPNESFNEESFSEKNHSSGFPLDKNLPATLGTKPKERNLPTITGTKPKGKDFVPPGTKPKGKDLVTAGTKPKGKDLVTAGTKQKGKDLVTAGTKPKGKDLITAGTKPKGKNLVTAGTKPKDKDQVIAGTKSKGKDQGTEGIKPKPKSGNMKDSSRLKAVKLIQPSPATKAKIGSKRLPEMVKSKVTATVESQQGSQIRKPASIISSTALSVKPAKEMFSGTESTLYSASESSQHHLPSLSTQSSRPHALLSASESSQQGTSTSTASSSRHIPKTVFKLPGQQTAMSGASLRGASSTLSSTSIPRALPRPGVAKRVIANTLDQSSSSALDSKSDPLEFSAVTKESANGKENVDRKTVIHVDHGTLWSDSSTDQQGSDSEFQKKKIPVDASIRSLSVPQIPHQPSIVSDIDDIPFADESEVDEKFFTPATSLKTKEVSSDSQVTDITSNTCKKIFPTLCAVNLNPNLPSAQQIQFIQEAERNKAQEALKAKPQLNTENGKGVSFVNPSYNTVGVVPKRVPGTRTVPNDPRDRRSSSYDTPSSSSILSDNEDSSKQVTTSSTTHMTTTPMTSASEMDSTTKARKKKNSKPLKSVGGDTKTKIHKHEDKSHSELEAKKEKRHSLLALLRPNKAAEKVRDKKDYSTSATPSESDYASDKKQKSKLKKKKKLSRSQENVEAGLSHDVKELKIAPVFEKDNDRRPAGAEGLLAESKLKVVQPLPMAPKAMLEDFSDSDESQISVSTLLRKKDGDPIDERVARKLERVAARQQKRAEQQRLRAAQEIQRRLQEVDERQQELENRGIAVEKALRGEGAEADVDESQLMGEWFNLVHEKNALVRYESELMVRAKELELEDRQSRLQQEFHDRSLKPESEKTAEEIEEDGQLLDELLDVVEQRNALVAMLEEDRLREQQEDRELENMMVKKGFVLAPLNYSRQPRAAPLDTSISRT